jgi:hypothetical protein
MIEFVREVNRAFSAGAFFVPRILGRCPRLAVNCAFGAKLAPVARIASLPRRSLGGSGRLGSTASQCAEDSAKFAFRTKCFWSAGRRAAAEALWRAGGLAPLSMLGSIQSDKEPRRTPKASRNRAEILSYSRSFV